jgi:acyl-CoA thioesterase-1
MKSTLVLLALIAFVLGGIWYWKSHAGAGEDACSLRVPAPVIVAFGDSLVAGYGAPDGEGFVSDLSHDIGLPITNLGESGDTSAMGLARIDDVLNAKPDIAIVLLGGNDALQKVSETTTTTNLDMILSTLTQAHIKVVLVGVQGALLSDPYADMYRSLAERHSVILVPNVLAGIIGHSDLMSDEVHPNARGYQKIAEKIAPALLSTCAKK